MDAELGSYLKALEEARRKKAEERKKRREQRAIEAGEKDYDDEGDTGVDQAVPMA